MRKERRDSELIMDKNEDQSYEVSIRLLGNELLAVKLNTTSTTSRWMFVAVATMFSLLVVLGAYGEKFASLFQSVIN